MVLSSGPSQWDVKHQLEALENAVAVVYVLRSGNGSIWKLSNVQQRATDKRRGEALGGSTNAVLHTLAIAHEARTIERPESSLISLSLWDFGVPFVRQAYQRVNSILRTLWSGHRLLSLL